MRSIKSKITKLYPMFSGPLYDAMSPGLRGEVENKGYFPVVSRMRLGVTLFDKTYAQIRKWDAADVTLDQA